jgi:RNA polymerase sigma-70 factor (ECF subfamily)
MVDNDRTLIQAARRGDLDAFNQLVLRYQDLIYRHAFSLLKEDDAAQDITQEVLIKAFRSLPNYRDGSFRVWLLRITINACYDVLRAQKRRPVLPLVAYDPDGSEGEISSDHPVDPRLSVEEQVEMAELRSTLESCLAELPIDYRTIIVLVDVLELDYAQAARILDIPIGTVKSRLARARLRLLRQLNGKDIYLFSAASSSISWFSPNGRNSSQLVLPGSRLNP